MHLYRNGKDFLDTSNLLIFLVHFGVPVDGSSGDHHGHAKTLKDTMYLTLVLMGGGGGGGGNISIFKKKLFSQPKLGILRGV